MSGDRCGAFGHPGAGGSVGLAYHTPAGPHADSAALQVLAGVLNARPSGRLFKALVETKKATNVFASAGGDHDPSLFLLGAEVRDPKQLDAVRDELLSLVEKIGKDGVTDEEVNRATQEALQDEPPAPESAMVHLYSDRVDPCSEEFDKRPEFRGDPQTMVDLINATLREEMRRLWS